MEGYEEVQVNIQRKYDACRKQLLEFSKNQDFVLDASDKKWNQEIEECCDLNFSKENIQEELMIVHATDYFPENGEIKTSFCFRINILQVEKLGLQRLPKEL